MADGADLTGLSIAVLLPCYNEEACLAELHARLGKAARAAAGEDYEIVLVNDGSRDRTWTMMREMAAADPRLVAINLSRNHGHQLALTAGLDLCSGERILIIDADLQDPPELLAEMLVKMRDEEADVVYGVRRSRAGETAFKRASAHGFYRLLSRATEVDIPVDAGDFRLMSRRALDALMAMPEQARFIRGMVAWIGFKQVPIAYARDERFAGDTKYPLSKMLRFAFDALTGFSSAPLKLASHAGLFLSLGSVLLLAATFALFRPDFFMDRIAAPYTEVPAKEIFKVAGELPAGDRLVLQIAGTTSGSISIRISQASSVPVTRRGRSSTARWARSAR